MIRNQQIKNSQEIISYYNLIYKTINLFERLKLNDSFEIFYVFTYLLWNGYFSIDRSYQFSSDRYLLDGFFGMSIMTGKGVCLNNVELLDQIFKELDYDSYIVANKKIKPIHNEYNSYINRNIGKQPNLNRKPILTNHCCVLIRDNKYDYIYDPTNIMCFNLTSKKTADVIIGEGKIKISLFDTKILSSRKYNEIKEVFKQIYLVKKEQNIEEEKTIIEEKTEHLNKMCEENILLFEEFYKSNINNIKTISNQLQKKKI